MSLNAQQKDALAFQLAELFESGEPLAFVATLHRIAERQAVKAARSADQSHAIHWQAIANALALALAELTSQLARNRPS